MRRLGPALMLAVALALHITYATDADGERGAEATPSRAGEELAPSEKGAGLAKTEAAAAEGVPFELEAHRVFVPVSVAGSPPLRLFLDTGFTYPGIFLFHEERLEDLNLPEHIEVLVPGAGDEEPTEAVMADSVELRLGDTVLPLQWVVVSKGERTQSFPSEGIIGGTLFDAFAVEVDYAAMRLRLHDPERFSPDSTWTSLPIELKRGIPWLDASVNLEGEDEQSLRVYIDLADDYPLVLLTGPQRRFAAPAAGEEVYLGTGLSGDIHGKIGKAARLKLGPYELHQVKTAFAPAATRSKQDGADGILGNGLLERFHVVFHYRGGRLLLKPNERFGDPFE
jgi:hypothetical protein